MTKLLEWISVVSAALAVWYSLVGGYVKHPVLDQNMNIILLSPIVFVILFGLYAATVVLYRVFTFNNCEDAAKELQVEILEARKDLEDRGLKCHRMSTAEHTPPPLISKANGWKLSASISLLRPLSGHLSTLLVEHYYQPYRYLWDPRSLQFLNP